MTRSPTLRALALALVALGAVACGGRAPVVPASEGAPEPPASTIHVGDDPCTSDADCFPADCCHATSCVAAANTPMCENIACTLECRPGTIDCGGGCLCVEGRCAARVMQRF